MYTRIRRGIKNGAYNYCEFVADSESDISNLPTTSSSGKSGVDVYEPCCAGSKVYITDLCKSYILSNSDEWKIFTNYASGQADVIADLAGQKFKEAVDDIADQISLLIGG